MEFPAISLACCVEVLWTRGRIRTHEKPCGLRAAACCLHFADRSTQAAWFLMRAHSRSRSQYFHAERKWNCWNSIAPLVEMQRKLKYVQFGAACGKVWTGFKSGQPAREWAHSLRRVNSRHDSGPQALSHALAQHWFCRFYHRHRVIRTGGAQAPSQFVFAKSMVTSPVFLTLVITSLGQS